MLLLENCGAQENKRMIPANYFSWMAEYMSLGTAVVDNSLFISIFPMLGAMIYFDMIPITQGFQAAAISSERERENLWTVHCFPNKWKYISAEEQHAFQRATRFVFLVWYIKHKQSKAASKFSSVMVFYNVSALSNSKICFSLSYVCCI